MPAMLTPSSKVWQHPFVDVFRNCGLKQWPQGNFAKEGNAKLAMDRSIGHQVITLAGAVPAANYMQLPQDRTEGLGLTGGFLYLQILVQPADTYSIHVDVKTTDRNTTRISISNLFNPDALKCTQRSVQIPYSSTDGKWTVLALDLASLLAPVTSAAFEETKTIQFCANMVVRGAFTADNSYTRQNLPKDMVLSHALAPADLNWVWMPQEPVVQLAPLRELSSNIKPALSSQKSSIKLSKPSLNNPSTSRKKALEDAAEQVSAQHEQSEPWLQLQHINGYTGEFTRVMTWLPNSQELVFAAGNVIVIMHSSSGVQRHLLGCANNLCALACSGQVIVSAEAGKLGLIRLWDAASGQCQALLHGHAGGINCLDLSPDGRFLVAVGLNNHSKQLVILWNVTGLVDGQKAQVLAKYISDYNIKAIKFSPYEEGRLMTCGKDSVRMFRLKMGHLRGMSVHVTPAPGEMSKGSWLDTNVFTDIAFETGCGLLQLEERHVFVTSISGAVYQINYGTRTLERVYQLHSAAINCMLVSEGLCVTGSDDKFLRVWPLDFSDFLLEAEHEAGVTAIGLAPDGLTIAIGTENGVIGCLDVPTHQYRTLLRSHTDTINAVAVDTHRGEYCTVSSDGTIRGWDIASHAQLFELAAPGEVIQCCAYHPDRHELACGFDQGRVRIFDIAETALLQEHKQHRQGVLQVLYLPSGKLLFSLGVDGNLCVYEVAHTYLPIKYLSTAIHHHPGCIAAAPNSSLLATVSRSDASPMASILLFHGSTLEAIRRIESTAPGFTNLLFSQDGSQLLATTADRRLLTYAVGNGQLMQEQSELHKVGVDTVALHPSQALIATGGADRLIKIWPCHSQAPSPTATGQSFIGHSDIVTGLAWANDHSLISTSAGDAILIWHLKPAALLTPDTDPNLAPVNPHGHVQVAPPNPAGRLADAPAANMTEAFDDFQRGEPGLLQQSLEASASRLEGLTEGRHTADTGSSAAAQPSMTTKALSVTTVVADGFQQSTAEAVLLESQHQLVAGSVVPAEAGEPKAGKPAAAEPHLQVQRVIGFNGDSRGTCAWQADSGLLLYAANQCLIVEQLATREQRCLVQHTTGISCLAVTPDGSLIASASPPPPESSSEPSVTTAQICLWHVATATCLHVMHHHSCGVQALSFSHDGVWLLSAGKDPEQNVVIWDVETGAALTSGTTSQPVIDLAWRPHTPLPAFVTLSKSEVLAWELESSHLAQRCLRLPPPLLEAPLTALGPHLDGTLFLGDANGNIWRLQIALNSSLVTCFKCCGLGSDGPVTCLQAHQGCLLASSAEGQLVRFAQQPNSSIWVEDKRVCVTGRVNSLDAAEDASQAVVGSSMGTIWYVDMHGGSEVPVVTSHTQAVTCLALPTSELRTPLMATTCQDGVLRIWQMPSQPADWHQACAVMEFQSQQACTAAAIVSRGGSACCAAGYEGGRLRLFDLATALLAWTAQCHSSATAVLAVELSPSGKELLTVARDGSIALCSLQDGGLLGQWEAHMQPEQQVDAAVFAPGNKDLLALACARRLTVLSCPWQQKPCTAVSSYACPQGHVLDWEQTGCNATAVFGPEGTDCLLYSSPLLVGKLVEYNYQCSTTTRVLSMQHQPTALSISSGRTMVAFADAAGSVGLMHYKTGQAVMLKGRIMVLAYHWLCIVVYADVNCTEQ
ncbi:TPA: hypothetical protein ACH3X2_010098 [Trebouxia sp. C0005]